jgi:hypothetical protein
LLLAILCKTFPAYKIEDLERMEDLSLLMRAANLHGYYEAFQHAKATGWKDTDDPAVSEIMVYEAKLAMEEESKEKS